MVHGTVEGRERHSHRGLLPILQSFRHLQRRPQRAQRRCQGGTIRRATEGFLEIPEGRHRSRQFLDHFVRQLRLALIRRQLLPFIFAHTPGEGDVFKIIHERGALHDQPRFQRGDPIVMPSAQRHESQGAAGQFGDGMVGHQLAMVGKKRNVVPAKSPVQHRRVILHAPHDHTDLAVAAVAGADVVVDQPGRQQGFRLGIGTFNQVQIGPRTVRNFWRVRPA
ncbi:MAG: hypothetical protein BWX84_03230 [Verrucomicrobia bacterium ADurb.Bin118]|nr:MAG: hypothetical protein BWX84_03230 [Verrucomicrobia bacterium ADurb.Bin118]